MFGKHRSVSAALSGGKKSVGSFYNVKIKNLLPAYSFLFGWQLSRIVRPRRGEHHWDLSIRGGCIDPYPVYADRCVLRALRMP